MSESKVAVIDPDSPADLRRLHQAIVAGHGDPAAIVRMYLNPPRPECSAHGNFTCPMCSRISSEDVTQTAGCVACGEYDKTGMHSHTCPRRIAGNIYANRNAVLDAMWPAEKEV